MLASRFLATTGLLAVTGAALLSNGTAAASASTPRAASQPPLLVSIGGVAINSNASSVAIPDGSSRRPVFTAVASGTSQVGRTVAIMDLDAGVVCDAKVQSDLLASCSPDHDMKLGRTDIGTALRDAASGELPDIDESYYIHLSILLPTPTITLDSYDTGTKTATVSGIASIDASGVRVASGGGFLQGASFDPITGAWHATVPVSDPEHPVSAAALGGNSQSASARVWLPGARLAPPKVTSTVAGSTARLHVTANPRWTAVVKDARGQTVAQATSVYGSVDVVVPIPDHEARYTVSVHGTDGIVGDFETDPTTVVVNEGIGEASSPAPTIGAPVMQGARAAIPVTAEPGSVVTVKDHDGKTVGLKAIGASGTAQIALAVPSTRETRPTVYSAQQGSAGVLSLSTVFTLRGDQ